MSKKGIVIVGLLLIALVAVAQYTFDWIGVGAQDMRMENTMQYVSYSHDAIPSFHSNNSRFFYFTTRTGIRYVTSGGESRWQEQFTLTRPHMASRGDIVAVGEDEGRFIRVYNANGLMYTEALDNPVLGFSVNSGGDLAVIMGMDGGYQIHAFRPHGTEPFFRSYFHHRDNPMRFPISVEISEDGDYLAIAYLNIYRNMVSEVEFYFAGQQARFGTEALFAWREFPDETFITMRFMSNNQLLIITDSQIVLQSIDGNSIREEWAVPLHNRIDQLAFCGNNRFAFASGAPLSPDGRDADPVGTVNIFNMNGLTGRFYLGRRATHLTMGHNAVIVGADRYFRAINSLGVSLWQHTALHDVRDMIFLDNTNTVLIAGPNRAYVWRRQRARGD